MNTKRGPIITWFIFAIAWVNPLLMMVKQKWRYFLDVRRQTHKKIYIGPPCYRQHPTKGHPAVLSHFQRHRTAHYWLCVETQWLCKVTCFKSPRAQSKRSLAVGVFSCLALRGRDSGKRGIDTDFCIWW